MIKRLSYLLLLIFFYGCNNADGNDCFQTAGEIIQQEIEVESFKKIVIHERVGLVIEEGPVQKVVIETGSNLISDVTVEVINNELVVRNHNACNFVRDYGITKVLVTSPDINTIRNASERSVISKGILNYPSIYLRSSGEETNYLSIGDFHLNIENESVKIWGNGIANFYLEGTSNNLDLSFSDGNTRFHGKDFIVKDIIVRQVSANDMVVYPTESLTGSIHSTGDVISYNKPPIVDIDIQSDYGKLIFK